jgi:hypothetical protein
MRTPRARKWRTNITIVVSKAVPIYQMTSGAGASQQLEFPQLIWLRERKRGDNVVASFFVFFYRFASFCSLCEL